MRGSIALLLLLIACGDEPQVEATNARHVLIEIAAHEYVDKCQIPCRRALRQGERIARCAAQEAGWYLSPRFEGERGPRRKPAEFDMAERLGPLVEGYALCTLVEDKH